MERKVRSVCSGFRESFRITGHGSLSLGPREPMLTTNVGEKTIRFLVDTDMNSSVVTWPVVPLVSKSIHVQGATGQSSAYSFCECWQAQLE